MKKCIIVILLSVTAAFSFSLESAAADFMIGFRSGYYSWEPYLKDLGASGMSDMDPGSGTLYGPLFSIMFTDNLAFSVASLFGRQSTQWQAVFSDFDSNTEVTGNYSFEVFRADIDSALSYRISDSFKIFAGYKYQYMEIKYSYTEVRTDKTNDTVTEIDVPAGDPEKSPFHGPALGIGYSLPLTANYFCGANLSGLYMWGKTAFAGERYSASDGGGYILNDNSSDTIKIDTRQAGVNFEPVIGMNPGNNLPIVTLGFRYQRSWVQFTDDQEEISDKWLDDTILGVFVTIVYMF